MFMQLGMHTAAFSHDDAPYRLLDGEYTLHFPINFQMKENLLTSFFNELKHWEIKSNV